MHGLGPTLSISLPLPPSPSLPLPSLLDFSPPLPPALSSYRLPLPSAYLVLEERGGDDAEGGRGRDIHLHVAEAAAVRPG